MRRSAVIVVFFLSCRCNAVETTPGRALPFTVRCEEIQLSEAAAREVEQAVTPALFTDPDQLTRLTTQLVEALRETGIFTRVVMEDEAAVPADLLLQIKVNSYDFGPSEATLPGAVYSTLAWFFVGAGAWLIEDRQYADSEVSLSVVLSDPGQPEAIAGGRAADAIFEDVLFLKGIQLSFAERSDYEDWFWNLFVPPFVGEGDPDNAGRSLVERSPAFFAEHEPPRILSSFPALYFRRLLCYVGYYPERGELVLVSKADVDHVTIRAEGGEVRSLGEMELAELTAKPEETDDLWRWLTERVVGLGIEPTDQYFRIPLEPGEKGFVRVEANLEGEGPPARWTIYRGEPAERSG